MVKMVITRDPSDIRRAPPVLNAGVNFNVFLSRLDRGVQSATEMSPLNRGHGVARSCTTAPPRLSDMHLADALV